MVDRLAGRMHITDTDILAYLHDAKLLGFHYDSSRSPRSVELELSCDSEAGYAPWDGKRLVLRLEGTTLLRMRICGYVASNEYIDSWNARISEEMEAELESLRLMGCDCSGIQFTLSFSTGAYIEDVCQQVVVDLATE